jgi:hypothetical protein
MIYLGIPGTHMCLGEELDYPHMLNFLNLILNMDDNERQTCIKEFNFNSKYQFLCT